VSDNSPSLFVKEKQKYEIFDREISYRKGDSIVLMTNYSVRCTGYVAKYINATTAEGFLVDVIPKDSVRLHHDDCQTSRRNR
jgi:hypothetical protein